MADGRQNVGLGEDLVFAGDMIRIDFTVTTSGVTVAEWGVFLLHPSEVSGSQTTEASKTIGSGITVADGPIPGTVVASVVVQPADTADLSGDYYHELKLTASGDEVHVSSGTIRLQPSAL